MLLSPVSLMFASVSSDPGIIDNGNMTKSVIWNFTNPTDYSLSSTVVAGGLGSLEYMNETNMDDTSAGYDLGTKSNTNSQKLPDSLVIDNTSTPVVNLTLQPGPADGTDTYLSNDQANNNYGNLDLKLDSNTGKENRIVMRFDLSSVPAGAAIYNATLLLFMKNGKWGEFEFNIYPLKVAFNETEATWMKYDQTHVWDTPGGDYYTMSMYRASIDYTYKWHSFDMSRLVDLWVTGKLPNDGFIIVPTSASGDLVKTFVASESVSAPELRPKLAINYTIPGKSGSFESRAIGLGTNATFTLASWSNSTASLVSDEFPGAPLASRWSWLNDPREAGGDYQFTRPGWLTVTSGFFSEMRVGSFTCNILYQNILGEFNASTSLEEHFVDSTMAGGLMLLNDEIGWLAVYKYGFGANGTIEVVVAEGGVTRSLGNISWPSERTAFLGMERTAAGIRVSTSHDGSSWSTLVLYTPLFDFSSRAKLGICVFSGLTSNNAVVDFDYVRIASKGQVTDFTMKARAGNSTSFADPSWGAWSAALAPGSGTMLGWTGKYVQYQISMTTPVDWISPIFSGFTCHDERYAVSGTIVTNEFVPTSFGSWKSLAITRDAAGGGVQVNYSTNGGAGWTSLGTGAAFSLSSVQPSMMIHLDLWTSDTLTTPTVDTVEVVYSMAVSHFYIVVPSSVVAGETFDVTIEVKDSANNTLTGFSDTAILHATNAAGTGNAASELLVTAANIPLGGVVTVSDESYTVAETIRIQVTYGIVSSLSNPIQVLPGPVSAVAISPSISAMLEYTTQTFTASAVDAYGNTITGAVLDWTVDSSLGVLDHNNTSSVNLTVGIHFTQGNLTVESNGHSATMHIDVSPVLFAPYFLKPVEEQVRDEDSGEWTLNLTTYVADLDDTHEELRWYTTQESVISVRGENRTGNMIITFATKQDKFGTNILNLVVVDPEGMTASTAIVVTINSINDPPTIDSIEMLVVHYDSPYLYNFEYYVHDVDTPVADLTLSVDASSVPFTEIDGLTISFTYGLRYNDTIQTVVVTVSDGQYTSSTAVLVKVTGDNVPVILDGLPPVEIRQGETIGNVFPYPLEHYFRDPDRDVLFYATGNKHVIIAIMPNNTVNMTGPQDWFGDEHVIFQAVDPQGARVEQACKVTVISVPKPPIFNPVPDLQVRFDLRYEFDLAPYVYDPDDPDDALEYTVDDMRAYFEGTVLSMLFGAETNGTTIHMNVTVSDGIFHVIRMVNVTVSDNNPPRVSTALPDHTFQEDAAVRYPIGTNLANYFTDDDVDLLTFWAFSSSANVTPTMVSDPSGYWFISFEVSKDYYGFSELTIRCTDAHGALVEVTINLDVLPVPDAPMLSLPELFEVTEGVQKVFSMESFVTDPDSFFDHGDFTLEVRVLGPEGTSLAYTSSLRVLPGMIVFNFPAGFLGKEKSHEFDIEVRITDQDGKSATDTLTVRVVKAAGAPGLSDWYVVGMLIVGATALGLFAVTMRMRKKPFMMHDMMLIHNDGFLIGRYASHVAGEIDQDILSGMLTAVLNFVEDSMSTSADALKTFGFKEYQVLVKRGQKVFVAVVYSGDLPDSVEGPLGEFLNTVERVYKKKIAGWTGDIDTDFAGVEVLVQGFVKEHSKGHVKAGEKTWSMKGKQEPAAK